jgi:RNA polymerase sigma-70 factor, ECF subfamily
MGRLKEARNAYQDALRLTRQGPEQRFLQQRLDDLGSLKN